MNKPGKLNIHDLIKSGQILASALQLSKQLIQPKTTPQKIDLQVRKFIISNGGLPCFEGLGGYPYPTCISVNEQVVHGVPTNRPFKNNDVVTVDIGVSYNGHCTDAARTYVVGNKPNKRTKHMIRTAHKALNAGISQAKPSNKVGDISYAIQKHIFNGKYKTTLGYGGHGIGFSPHSDPFIPNYGQRDTGLQLILGMCLAIEPILIDGSNDVLEDEEDGWTVYSPDGCLSAHVEDTIIVANTPIILTRRTLNGNTV